MSRDRTGTPASISPGRSCVSRAPGACADDPARLASSGDVVSLLARMPRRGTRRRAGSRRLPLAGSRAAGLAVTVVGLVGLGLAVVVV